MSIAAIGIDIGSATAKMAGVDAAGEMVWHHLEPSDPRAEQQAVALLSRARAEAGPDVPVVSTGYGRKLVAGANRVVTEITCHARGVYRAMGHGGTLVDIGGQDSKVILISDAGAVVNFKMNDKCAAGTGRFLEVAAARLKVPLDELGATALGAPGEVPISSTCTVFAESEMVSLLARGEPVENIVRGLTRSLVSRVVSLARGASPRPPYMLSGGVARSAGVRQFLAEAFSAEVELPEHPQLMGAYGAALIGLG